MTPGEADLYVMGWFVDIATSSGVDSLRVNLSSGRVTCDVSGSLQAIANFRGSVGIAIPDWLGLEVVVQGEPA